MAWPFVAQANHRDGAICIDRNLDWAFAAAVLQRIRDQRLSVEWPRSGETAAVDSAQRRTTTVAMIIHAAIGWRDPSARRISVPLLATGDHR